MLKKAFCLCFLLYVFSGGQALAKNYPKELTFVIDRHTTGTFSKVSAVQHHVKLIQTKSKKGVVITRTMTAKGWYYPPSRWERISLSLEEQANKKQPITLRIWNEKYVDGFRIKAHSSQKGRVPSMTERVKVVEDALFLLSKCILLFDPKRSDKKFKPTILNQIAVLADKPISRYLNVKTIPFKVNKIIRGNYRDEGDLFIIELENISSTKKLTIASRNTTPKKLVFFYEDTSNEPKTAFVTSCNFTPGEQFGSDHYYFIGEGYGSCNQRLIEKAGSALKFAQAVANHFYHTNDRTLPNSLKKQIIARMKLPPAFYAESLDDW